MNPIVKLILKLLSSPKIDMQEDYVWVRKLQNIFAAKPKNNYRVFDRSIYSEDGSHSIPIRVFHPKERKSDDILLFFHGGGWVLGNNDTYTKDCMKMAESTGRTVLSVDYRKAPEYPFPAGFEDCYRVVDILTNNLELTGLTDAKKLSLIGNSAGGNLVAAVCLRLRDEGKTLPGKQILINPVTYWDHTEQAPFESIYVNGFDYGLTSKKMQEYMEMYEPDEALRKSPYISPLMAADFSDLPDALIITSEFDPLRDEGEAYGVKLKEAGTYTRVFQAQETVHDYLTGPSVNGIVSKTYKLIKEFLDESLKGSEYIGKQNDAP
ncbi:alpha/beta hydrolase [Jeotgalibaca ciconiae]|nr:alpha/beta hydrolase [Jeotgalibaca ciconiae]